MDRRVGEICWSSLFFTVLLALALLLGQPALQLRLVGPQAAVHLLLLLQLLAELRRTSGQLSAPEQARREELSTAANIRRSARAWPGRQDASAVTYFFSKLCFSLVISETRCSRLSQRSRVSLNLDFMLFPWKDKASVRPAPRRRGRRIQPCAVLVPPRPPPSPGERSCSPSKSSETPAGWSAGTSTAGADNGPDQYRAENEDPTWGNSFHL